MRGLKLGFRLLRPLLDLSHPSWVRGLKLFDRIEVLEHVKVAPFMGAWIETSLIVVAADEGGRSHPSWVRGLKLEHMQGIMQVFCVAPFMGAWIETPAFHAVIASAHSRTLHGCVD